eukprot:m.385069 g.385069  ORF g.385069 m.385069 type:complete len:60 (-) comp16737_c2_seq7:848-1027(-)
MRSRSITITALCDVAKLTPRIRKLHRVHLEGHLEGARFFRFVTFPTDSVVCSGYPPCAC